MMPDTKTFTLPLLPSSDLNEVTTALADIVTALRNAKILLTGGTGFFGIWLTESFLAFNKHYQLNAQLFILSRDPNAFLKKHPHLQDHPALRWITGEMTHFTYPNEAMTHIIHAATPASAAFNESAPLEMLNIIIDGTRNLLNQCTRQQRKPNFLFVSSGAIYGEQPTTLTHISETYSGLPSLFSKSSAYAIGKLTAEHLCFQYSEQHDLPIKIARCFAFVGPHLPLDIHFAIGNFIRDGLQGNPITVGGDGSPFRSYQYASDLAIWLWTILIKGKSCRPYNVGSDEDYDIETIAHQVAAYFNVPVHIAKKRDPALPPKRYVPSIQRALRELELPPNLDLNTALQRTFLWLR